MTARSEHVHDKMIERWATRYRQIVNKSGETAGRAWLMSFINEEDLQRVLDKIREMRGRRI